MKTRNFSRLVDGFRKRRVLVIGDLILDRYIWGKVSRISPEAPVPVVDVINDNFMLGGAANVANNIVSLGGKAVVLGITGRDSAGEVLKKMLAASGSEPVLVEDCRPTSVKTRVIAHSQQVVRFDMENRDHLSGRQLKDMLALLDEQVGRADAVIISDYKKGVVSGELMRHLVKTAKDKFIAVDPKVGHFHLYKGVSLITPNLLEASEGSGSPITDEPSLLKAGRSLLGKLRLSAVLITRGEEGMSLFTRTGIRHIPTAAMKVFDVTGAGDTVIAAFSLAYASGATMEEAAVIANHAAGIVVAQVGTATATAGDLKKSLNDNEILRGIGNKKPGKKVKGQK
ncbi:MAG: D-glycero-beta-D-manno-heptose-7-phosphate kinase [Nitrospiraceae bacterium]|nr:D-glycero-beta-D-manno-heptose-7-phosphate kinase [Nitrospiraceae bacterium]